MHTGTKFPCHNGLRWYKLLGYPKFDFP
jgi:hypothetical protein